MAVTLFVSNRFAKLLQKATADLLEHQEHIGNSSYRRNPPGAMISDVKHSFWGGKRHAVGGKISEVGREHKGSLIVADEHHSAGVSEIHAWRPLLHFIENWLNQCGSDRHNIHARHELAQSSHCHRVVFKPVLSLGDRRLKRYVTGRNGTKSPYRPGMISIAPVYRRLERPGVDDDRSFRRGGGGLFHSERTCLVTMLRHRKHLPGLRRDGLSLRHGVQTHNRRSRPLR